MGRVGELLPADGGPPVAVSRIGAVVIGRNEAPRLRRCLESVSGCAAHVAYVDSDSSDDSVAIARDRGVPVVHLCGGRLTAARSRNAGLEWLRSQAPEINYVQFVDGDCEIRRGWMATAARFLEANPQVVAVCGHLHERHPEASIYNRLCQIEWRRTPGPIDACGGIAMFRARAVRDAGGYNEDLIAGEEPELCLRLRRAGGTIVALDSDMATHDAAMTRFGQWWRRTVRSGHALALGAMLHGREPERYRVRDIVAVALWAGLLPLAIVAAALIIGPMALVGLLVYPLQMVRVALRMGSRARQPMDRLLYGVFVVLGKFAQLAGICGCFAARLRRRRVPLIEYKDVTGPTGGGVLYIGNVLPALSETFVYREVLALRESGLNVQVASVRPPEPLDDPRLQALADEAVPVYGAGWARLLLHAAAEAVRHPLRTAGTLATAVADTCGRQVKGWGRAKVLVQAVGALALARRVRDRGIRHIHAHMAHTPTTIAMYAARQLGVSFSFTGHANDIFVHRILLPAKLRRARFACCISHWHRELYRGLANLPDERLPIVRCGVPVREDARMPTAARGGAAILAVGRLVPKKGFDILIHAVARLVQEGQAVSCTIIGGGPEQDRLTQLMQGLNLSDHIRLTGPRGNGEVMRALRDAGLFVLPCRVDDAGDRDGIPVVLMEAMAAGVCVVSGDLPAIRELVRPGETGVLVPPGDADALAGALAALLADPHQRQCLAERGREWVCREFSIAVNRQRLITAFQSVLGHANAA